MKNYVVCTYYEPFTEQGSYGHDKNPYHVSFHSTLCDARERAYQQARSVHCRAIEDSFINDDYYKFPLLGITIRVMTHKGWLKRTNFKWDKEHKKMEGAYVKK